MTLSVNANPSALLALQSLGVGVTDPQGVGGAAAASGADAAASSDSIYADLSPGAVSTAQDSVTAGVARATSIADAALSGGSAVAGLLEQMKAQATEAADPSLGSADRSTLNTDFQGLLQQFHGLLQGASLDGVNLIDGSQSSSLAVPTGSGALTLTPTNLSLGGPQVTVAATASLGTATAASSVLSQIEASLANVGASLSTLGSQADQLDAQSLLGSVNNLFASGSLNSDPSSDSARLMALSVQQGLSVQSAPIVNAQSSAILGLFRS